MRKILVIDSVDVLQIRRTLPVSQMIPSRKRYGKFNLPMFLFWQDTLEISDLVDMQGYALSSLYRQRFHPVVVFLETVSPHWLLLTLHGQQQLPQERPQHQEPKTYRSPHPV